MHALAAENNQAETAFLLRTDENERGTGRHSQNIIEIATDVRLRDAYQLEDGDWVEIEFP